MTALGRHFLPSFITDWYRQSFKKNDFKINDCPPDVPEQSFFIKYDCFWQPFLAIYDVVLQVFCIVHGRKHELTGFPPHGPAENWNLQVFCNLDPRKTSNLWFSAAFISGKPAFSSLTKYSSLFIFSLLCFFLYGLGPH